MSGAHRPGPNVEAADQLVVAEADKTLTIFSIAEGLGAPGETSPFRGYVGLTTAKEKSNKR